MADSDNTTPLSFVTRRRVLGATAIAIAGWERNAFAGEAAGAVPSDPTLAIWREWRNARDTSERLCDRSAYLERTLVETVGFPCATVQLPDGEEVTLHSIGALREVLGSDSDAAESRATAEALFAARQERWDAADREIGYSAALVAERQAADRAEELLEALSRTRTGSLAGVAAKLDAVLMAGQPSEDSDEFPWPQIRMVLEDIGRIARRIESGQEF